MAPRLDALVETAAGPAGGVLDAVVHPRSVALAGITVDNPGHWTRTFLDSLQEFGFDRPLYLVNPKGGEIKGMPVLRDLDEVPAPLDYVISTVPARVSPELVRKCARKGVKVVHFCTAGFGETGTPEGIALERQLVRAVRETGVRVLGPNCMGVYCPASRMSFEPLFPRESGPVGMISQSGGNATLLVTSAMWRGIRFSKVFSYGNACDLNECDLLEYLAADEDTRIIAIYLEGVRQGPRFRRALEEAAAVKPVVALKGGVTAGGARAAAGHTGSLAGERATWNSLCRQAGVIAVSDMEEMVDVLVALRFMRRPRGNGALAIGAGGGGSVMVADQFEMNGLRLPALPPETIERLREFSADAGNILRNPIDYSQSLFEEGKLERMVGLTLALDQMDFMVVFLNFGSAPSAIKRRVLKLADPMLRLMSNSAKPAAVVIEPSVVPETQAMILPVMQRFLAAGIPVFYSFSGAGKGIGALLGRKRAPC